MTNIWIIYFIYLWIIFCSYYPTETTCHTCNGKLSDPKLVTPSAKLLTLQGLIQGTCTESPTRVVLLLKQVLLIETSTLLTISVPHCVNLFFASRFLYRLSTTFLIFQNVIYSCTVWFDQYWNAVNTVCQLQFLEFPLSVICFVY